MTALRRRTAALLHRVADAVAPPSGCAPLVIPEARLEPWVTAHLREIADTSARAHVQTERNRAARERRYSTGRC